ncbi:MAG: mechanosensitive ion channel family protein, partial [Thermoplasmata archaeon]|nr:mechanosensitive ion channel family protein [Thermoplasmata archaeon]
VLLLVIGLLGAAGLVALREPLGNVGAKYFTDIYTAFRVGDSIRVAGVAGKVIEINAMTTVLLAENNELISVPNSTLIREVVVNTSPQAWKEVNVPITLPSNFDLPAFESDLLRTLAKLRLRLDQRFPPVLATKTRSAQSTDLVLTLMLRRPEERDVITTEVNKRVLEVLGRARGARR